MPRSLELHVVGRVVEVDAEPDLRGLVHDDVDPVHGPIGRRTIAHVADHQVDGGIHLRGSAVHVGAQRVEHPHVGAAGQQVAHDRAADESGTACDEDSHAALRASTVSISARAMSSRGVYASGIDATIAAIAAMIRGCAAASRAKTRSAVSSSSDGAASLSVT